MTLIELITVLAIIAIIATYAIPSYQRYQLKNDRTDALTALYMAVNDLEGCAAAQGGEFSDCSISSLEPVAGVENNFHSPREKYTIAMLINNANLFTLTASKQGEADDECHDFVIDALGQKQNKTTDGTSLSTDTVKKCWQM